MSDAMDPSGPPQPTQETAYSTSGNPVEKEPAEDRAAQYEDRSRDESYPVEQRIQQQQSSSIDDATPSSLGYGVHGAGPGEEAKGLGEENVGRHRELDAEQMAAPGEGDVAAAVGGRSRMGASGQQEDFAADLGRKNAEQAPFREAVQEARREEVDVGGVLGQRGGPADPVGKDDYPNTGDG